MSDPFHFASIVDCAGWLVCPGSPVPIIRDTPRFTSAELSEQDPLQLEEFYHARSRTAYPIEDLDGQIARCFGSPPNEVDVFFLSRLLSILTAHGERSARTGLNAFIPAWWVPGGALERLVWLAFIWSRGAANELLDNPHQRVVPYLPAYDLYVWRGGRRAMRADRALFCWGRDSIQDVASSQIGQCFDLALEQLLPVVSGGVRGSVLQVRRGSLAPDTQARNVRFVAKACYAFVRAASLAIRIVLHGRFESRRGGITDPCARALAVIATLDIERFMFCVARAMAQGRVEFSFAGEMDRLFGGRVREHGADLVRQNWGVLPTEEDGPRRAGPITPPGAKLLNRERLAAAVLARS